MSPQQQGNSSSSKIGDDDNDQDESKQKKKGKKGKKPAHKDPYNVPSSAHCEQMMPFGTQFGRLFPRFHPSWLQRVQTPVPMIPPFHLQSPNRGNTPGDRGRMWVR